jgi:hypothetical protein
VIYQHLEQLPERLGRLDRQGVDFGPLAQGCAHPREQRTGPGRVFHDEHGLGTSQHVLDCGLGKRAQQVH